MKAKACAKEEHSRYPRERIALKLQERRGKVPGYPANYSPVESNQQPCKCGQGSLYQAHTQPEKTHRENQPDCKQITILQQVPKQYCREDVQEHATIAKETIAPNSGKVR